MILYIFSHIALHTENKHNVKLKAQILQLTTLDYGKNVILTDCTVLRS